MFVFPVCFWCTALFQFYKISLYFAQFLLWLVLMKPEAAFCLFVNKSPFMNAEVPQQVVLSGQFALTTTSL